MQRRWVSEQIRLIQYIDDVTELRFLSEAIKPQKMIVDEEAQVEVKMLSRLPINRPMSRPMSRPVSRPARKLTVTTSNEKGLNYLQKLGSSRGSLDFSPSMRYSLIGIPSGSVSVIGSVKNCDYSISVSQFK